MHRWLSEQRPRTTSAGRTPACSRTPQAIDTKALPPAIATLGMIRTALFQKVRATRTFFLVEFTGYRRSASPLDNEGRGLKPTLALTTRGNAAGIAPRQRGAWIETRCRRSCPCPRCASPLDNEGRGLKHHWIVSCNEPLSHRPSTTRGGD